MKTGIGRTGVVARASRDALLEDGKLHPVFAEIAAAPAFYPAEGYHQDYHKKNSIRCAYYRKACRRDARLQEIRGAKQARYP